MATTNFTQHNPSAANQETDSAFDGNSLTTGGIGVDAIMPSDWMNKRWYQDSTFVAAFAQMMVNKGYSTSDANISTLVSVLGNLITNNDLKPAQTNVAFSPTPTFDCSLSNGFRIDLTGNVTSSAIINPPAAGTVITFYIVSDSPGNFDFVWPGNIVFARNVKTESQGNLFTQQFISDGTNFFAVETFLIVLEGQVAAAQASANAAAAAAAAAQGTANTAIAEIAALVSNSAQSVVTGSRVFGGTYQNTTSGMMMVSVTGKVGSGGGSMSGLVGPSSPSSVVCTQSRVSAASSNPVYSVCMMFMVPAGYFYSVSNFGLTLDIWTEWNCFV